MICNKINFKSRCLVTLVTYTNFGMAFGGNPDLHQLSLWFLETFLAYTSFGMVFVETSQTYIDQLHVWMHL